MSLNSKEQLKLDVITKVIQGKLSRRSAQQILAVSERSLRRYIKDFQENGPLFVKHKNWANVPANKTLSVLKNFFSGSTPCSPPVFRFEKPDGRSIWKD